MIKRIHYMETNKFLQALFKEFIKNEDPSVFHKLLFLLAFYCNLAACVLYSYSQVNKMTFDLFVLVNFSL